MLVTLFFDSRGDLKKSGSHSKKAVFDCNRILCLVTAAAAEEGRFSVVVEQRLLCPGTMTEEGGFSVVVVVEQRPWPLNNLKLCI